MNEHETEPVWGLPETPPEGERIVWQGQPAWREMALRTFHVRKIGLYFVLLAGIHVGLKLHDGASGLVAAKGGAWLLLLGLFTTVLLAFLARLYAKTTIYTITSRRLVMRFGVALPMMINIPWNKVEAADLKTHPGDHGSIALTLSKDRRISYWLLWPHAVPWRFSPVRPMLRCVADPQRVVSALQMVVHDLPDTVAKPIHAANDSTGAAEGLPAIAIGQAPDATTSP